MNGINPHEVSLMSQLGSASSVQQSQAFVGELPTNMKKGTE